MVVVELVVVYFNLLSESKKCIKSPHLQILFPEMESTVDGGIFYMKATGIVRRIDDLGRVVVPKEIRRTMRIREGEPMEIFTGREGEIVLKKYSPVGEMGEFARIFAELLAQNLGMLVGISDHDQFIAASGPEHRLLLGKSISGEMEETIRNRSLAFVEKGCRLTENGEERGELVVIQPIISAGDAIGAVVLVNGKEEKGSREVQKKLAEVTAGFLARQMEA